MIFVQPVLSQNVTIFLTKTTLLTIMLTLMLMQLQVKTANQSTMLHTAIVYKCCLIELASHAAQ